MTARQQQELEDELELENEDEMEGEMEFEDELEGELEGEWEDELEGEMEDEGEEFFRRIGRFARGAARGIGRVVRTAAPLLRGVARVALPAIGTAVGGPMGAMLGRAASQALGEAEMEDELEGEMEDELEGETEDEAEMLAAAGATAASEYEAEALVGAATSAVALSRADRQTLRRVMPHLVRGVSILTRVLRRRRATRPIVRTVPTIVRRTVRNLSRRAQSGRPVTRQAAARALVGQTARVLTRPRACAAALRTNVRATQRAATGRPRRSAGAFEI
ncbi:MAG TPA: hypothetical protein VNC50_21455 [Planctomycetia bacterium]|nr:hypothetical protein [Planctomycetia bacterium]